jgi:hypothetical protein
MRDHRCGRLGLLPLGTGSAGVPAVVRVRSQRVVRLRKSRRSSPDPGAGSATLPPLTMSSRFGSAAGRCGCGPGRARSSKPVAGGVGAGVRSWFGANRTPAGAASPTGTPGSRQEISRISAAHPRVHTRAATPSSERSSRLPPRGAGGVHRLLRSMSDAPELSTLTACRTSCFRRCETHFEARIAALGLVEVEVGVSHLPRTLANGRVPLVTAH